MEPKRDAKFKPNDEVDEIRWLSPDDAEAAVSYTPRRRAHPRRGRADRVNRERFPGLAASSWARLDGPAGTQMVDAAIEAMDAWMRSGRGANHGGVFAAAHATDELVESARASAGALLGAPPDEIVFGFSMTALTMAFAGAVGRTLEPGDEIVCTRLDHDANVRPWVIHAERNGRHACASPSRWARRSSCPRARSRRCCRSARAGSRSPTPPTPSARSPTSPGSSPPPTTPAPASTSTPCTPPRTAASTSPRSAATRSPAGPTSGSARTSASSGRARSCSPSCGPTSSCPPPTPSPTAGRTARCRSRRWPASPPPPTTRAAWTGTPCGAHEDALLAAALEGLDAIPGVTVHGRARDRTSTVMFTVEGHTSAAGRRRAGRARGRGLGRQLLRPRARALPRPRPPRRRPRRLRALQRRGRRRAAARRRSRAVLS